VDGEIIVGSRWLLVVAKLSRHLRQKPLSAYFAIVMSHFMYVKLFKSCKPIECIQLELLFNHKQFTSNINPHGRIGLIVTVHAVNNVRFN